MMKQTTTAFMIVNFMISWHLSAKPAQTNSHHDNIAWFKGSVEQAFLKAKTEKKPLFLYWGAQWCPPCNELKKNIFHHQSFANALQPYLSVYLDGDSEAAQIWGEKLNISGYPTILLMDSSGKELTRLDSNLSLTAFIRVLGESVVGTMSVAELIDAKHPLTSKQWRQLAYHSWYQDKNIGADTRIPLFERFAQTIPKHLKIVRNRFELLLLAAKSRRAQDPNTPLTDDEVKQGKQLVTRLFSNRVTRDNHRTTVMYRAKTIVSALYPEASQQRQHLIQKWLAASESIEHDPNRSISERLGALIPALDFHALQFPSKPLPAQIKNRVGNRVRWAELAASDHYSRQSAMSTAAWLLTRVEMRPQAIALLKKQLRKSPHPYYFMSHLGSILEDGGEKTQALAWYRKAWQTSTGPATRFQWGTSYLIHLFKLRPNDRQHLPKIIVQVFNELLQQRDAFAGRNAGRLKRFKESFVQWRLKNPSTVWSTKAIKDIASRCQKETLHDEQSDITCAAYFKKLQTI